MTRQNLITPIQAADYLGVSVRTLNKWRSDGSVSVPFKRIGRACRYSVSDLDAYLAQNSFNSVEG
mgnify:CR=1 FL=1